MKKVLANEINPPLEVTATPEVTCWNGHDPIRYNVMCLEAGATNRMHDGCPLCKVLEEFTVVLNGECDKCGESFYKQVPRVRLHHDFLCERCGDILRVAEPK